MNKKQKKLFAKQKILKITNIFLKIFYIILFSISMKFILNHVEEVKYFKIDDYSIKGNQFVEKKQIESIINNHIKNNTVYSINLNKLSDEINSNAFIHSSKIHTLLPSTIYIKIQEVNPIGLIEIDDDFYFIDFNTNLIKANVESINYFDIPHIINRTESNMDYSLTADILKKIILNISVLLQN